MPHEATALLAVNPKVQVSEQRHIRLMGYMPRAERTEMQWTHLCKQVERRHRVANRIGELATFATLLAIVLTLQEWAALLVNPIIALGMLADKFTGFKFGFLIAVAIISVIVLARMFKDYGHIFDLTANEWRKEENRQDTLEVAAIHEEYLFRDGAEGWTLWQRFKSCLIFAGAHAASWWYGIFLFLFVPFACGVTFMAVYLYTFKKTGSRQSALKDAAIVHYWHNRMSHRPLSLFVLCVTVNLAMLGLVLL